MKLIDDWKQGWKWFSVQIPALNIAFLTTWGMMPAKFQDAIPLPVVLGIAIALMVAGTVGRLIDQKAKP